MLTTNNLNIEFEKKTSNGTFLNILFVVGWFT